MNENEIEKIKNSIKEKTGNKRVIAAVSGGGDSTLAAWLAKETIEENLYAIFVDSGLLRSGERERAIHLYEDLFGKDFMWVDASKEFLSALKGVADPEEKRKAIGKQFIEVFERVAKEVGAECLIQGTIAPDWIESGGGSRDRIKTHHNVGGLPETFLRVIEPLRDLYKDEVRDLIKETGLKTKEEMQPFPGPGLAIRIIGEVTRERIEVVRKANDLVEKAIEESGVKPWQYFAVLLPVKSVGVKGDERVYGETIAIRAIDSADGMSGSFSKIPFEALEAISAHITNEIPCINRVVYDITDKPPATIEWE